MKKSWVAPGLVAFLILAIVASVGYYVIRHDAERAELAKPAIGMEKMRIPEFTLVDQNGDERTAEIFQGRITILDFSFTHCPFICPGMNAQMLRLQHKLRGTGVRFVSISVDPERDTPERLREYAAEIGADLSTWTFLTGDMETIKRIVTEALGFDLRSTDTERIPLPGGGAMDNIIHPSRLLLVDERRGVIGMYQFDFEPDMDKLEYRARVLATR